MAYDLHNSVLWCGVRVYHREAVAMRTYKLVLQLNTHELTWEHTLDTMFDHAAAATNIAEYWARKLSAVEGFRCIVVFDITNPDAVTCLGECSVLTERMFQWKDVP